MKKSIQFKSFFASLLILFFTACIKDLPEVELSTPAKYIPEVIAIDENLIALDDAMKRFDPLYLQVIYKEKRTKEELQNLSQELLVAFNKNNNNEVAKKALLAFYHFESFEALLKASNALTQNAAILKFKFFNQNVIPSPEQRLVFYKANKAFLKNKLNSLEKAKQKRAAGLWNDMVDQIEREFHYYTLVYNEELASEMGGGDIGCNEPCCYEYKSCLTIAASTYRSDFIFLGSSLAASGGALGSLYGSIIPFIGTSAVGIGGGILGGVTGFIQAVNIYIKNQEACLYSYKACILRKNEK
jgi:hypothetical protein